MDDHFDNQQDDADMNNFETTFDNLTILKELSNIVNLVKNDDFLETVPKDKYRRVKWVPMFNCLKQGLFDEMVQELSSMWEFENMPEKLEILEKQKRKFIDVIHDNWRPQHNDVKAQLKASDVQNMRKHKLLLESLAREHETRINRLKNNLTAKRGYIKAMQMDILKYQKKNEYIIDKINEKIGNHSKLMDMLITNPIDIDDIHLTHKDMEYED